MRLNAILLSFLFLSLAFDGKAGKEVIKNAYIAEKKKESKKVGDLIRRKRRIVYRSFGIPTFANKIRKYVSI